MNPNAHLQVNQLSCVRQQKMLFKNISFELALGELLLVSGCNGAGKSSLLQLLCGFALPQTGEVLWQGKSIYATALNYQQQLHFVGHSNGIKLGLTVQENLQLALCLAGSVIKQFDPVLTQIQLQDFVNTPATYLSAGQKRRLALARLLLIPKLLWLLDEPFTALDTETQQLFILQLEQHLKNGGMAIISSHQDWHLPSTPIKHLRLPAC